MRRNLPQLLSAAHLALAVGNAHAAPGRQSLCLRPPPGSPLIDWEKPVAMAGMALRESDCEVSAAFEPAPGGWRLVVIDGGGRQLQVPDIFEPALDEADREKVIWLIYSLQHPLDVSARERVATPTTTGTPIPPEPEEGAERPPAPPSGTPATGVSPGDLPVGRNSDTDGFGPERRQTTEIGEASRATPSSDSIAVVPVNPVDPVPQSGSGAGQVPPSWPEGAALVLFHEEPAAEAEAAAPQAAEPPPRDIGRAPTGRTASPSPTAESGAPAEVGSTGPVTVDAEATLVPDPDTEPEAVPEIATEGGVGLWFDIAAGRMWRPGADSVWSIGGTTGFVSKSRSLRVGVGARLPTAFQVDGLGPARTFRAFDGDLSAWWRGAGRAAPLLGTSLGLSWRSFEVDGASTASRALPVAGAAVGVSLSWAGRRRILLEPRIQGQFDLLATQFTDGVTNVDDLTRWSAGFALGVGLASAPP